MVRTVNVTEDTLPVISLIGESSVTIEVFSSYNDDATAIDNYDGDITSSIVSTVDVDPSILGVYTISYNVSDSSGNTAIEVTRNVNVVDTTVPLISLLETLLYI